MSKTPLVQPVPRRWRGAVGEYLGLLGALVALVTVFGLATEHFLSRATFLTIANQIPAALLVGVAMTFVLIIAEIDLSVGSVLGFCSCVLGVAMTRWEWPLPLAVLAAMAAGLLCGGFNGMVSSRWRLPSFIVTLGMLEMARGAAHWLTRSQTQYVGQSVGGLAETQVLGLSLPFLIAVLVVMGAHPNPHPDGFRPLSGGHRLQSGGGAAQRH